MATKPRLTFSFRVNRLKSRSDFDQKKNQLFLFIYLGQISSASNFSASKSLDN